LGQTQRHRGTKAGKTAKTINRAKNESLKFTEVARRKTWLALRLPDFPACFHPRPAADLFPFQHLRAFASRREIFPCLSSHPPWSAFPFYLCPLRCLRPIQQLSAVSQQLCLIPLRSLCPLCSYSSFLGHLGQSSSFKISPYQELGFSSSTTILTIFRKWSSAQRCHLFHSGEPSDRIVMIREWIFSPFKLWAYRNVQGT